MAAPSTLHSTIDEPPYSAVLVSRIVPEYCVVVADGASARIFRARPVAGCSARLVEYADLAARDALHCERDFADAIVGEVQALAGLNHLVKVVLVAPPRSLGLLREPLQQLVGPAVPVMALARDYTDLSSEQLSEILDLS